MRSGDFRAGVGICVVDDAGRLLAFERADVPGAWQLPQGGIEPNESPMGAARRELEEETGIAWGELMLLDEYPVWLGYELPAEARSEKTGRGQVHRWFLLRHRAADDGHSLASLGDDGDAEFVDWRWVTAEELLRTVWPVRRPVYEALIRRWDAHLT